MNFDFIRKIYNMWHSQFSIPTHVLPLNINLFKIIDKIIPSTHTTC